RYFPPSRLDVKAILVPSGDHVGTVSSMDSGSVVSARRCVPSAFMTQILKPWDRSLWAYAIIVPSGDQAGATLNPSFVIVTGLPPSASMILIHMPSSVWWTYAILLPSGDHAGIQFCRKAGPLSCVSCVRSAPSGRMVKI